MPLGSQREAGSAFVGFIPIILIFLIFYFLVIRPQQKKVQEHKQMISSIKQGDQVMTSGGIIGTVNKLIQDDSVVMVEIANNVIIKVSKDTIMNILNKQQT
ncbi:preprotein translocase subunit YajC [Rickettsiales bacterium]|nr:preprotein translocase subunit YajC [Rickettsiales bacterium]